MSLLLLLFWQSRKVESFSSDSQYDCGGEGRWWGWQRDSAGAKAYLICFPTLCFDVNRYFLRVEYRQRRNQPKVNACKCQVWLFFVPSLLAFFVNVIWMFDIQSSEDFFSAIKSTLTFTVFFLMRSYFKHGDKIDAKSKWCWRWNSTCGK